MCGIGLMLGLLLASAVYLNPSPMPAQDLNSAMGENTLRKPASAVSHAPIFIDGDDPANDWDDCDVVTGNGTVEDPYVIADLEIDAGGSGSGIYILDSTAYLTIVNCSISNAGSGQYDAGIRIEYCENVQISQSNLHYNLDYGIYIRYSQRTIVTGNNISSNAFCGIIIDFSNATIFVGNTVTDHTWYGVILYDGAENTEIFSNAISGNGYGIYVYMPGFESIVGNWIWDHGFYDIVDDGDLDISSSYSNNYYTI